MVLKDTEIAKKKNKKKKNVQVPLQELSVRVGCCFAKMGKIWV